ncbi:hypothetical protein ACFQAS_08760 [Halopenitus salinus]|uniref:Uncharacterized protein n=1 Tax=Halopenitus salinus TaxID=1198295 RepID=A0ABD5USL5_9EURY
MTEESTADDDGHRPAFRTLAAVGTGYLLLLAGILLVVFVLPYLAFGSP